MPKSIATLLILLIGVGIYFFVRTPTPQVVSNTTPTKQQATSTQANEPKSYVAPEFSREAPKGF